MKVLTILSGLVFINQVIRFPLLLSLVESLEVIETYFIVVATMIPVQFYANDILQYGKSKTITPKFEKHGLASLIIISIVYLYFKDRIEVVALYIIFSLSLLYYSYEIGSLRQISTPKEILTAEATANSVNTILALISAYFFSKSESLSFFIIISQSLSLVLVGFSCKFQVKKIQRNEHENEVFSSDLKLKSNFFKSCSFILFLMMVGTQLERLIISGVQPNYLAYIALAAGVAQGLRRMLSDDAVVFHELKENHGTGFEATVKKIIYKSRVVFYGVAAFVFVLIINKNAIYNLYSGLPILSNLGSNGFFYTAYILLIYLSAMPVGVVAINLARVRDLTNNALGLYFVFFILFVESVFLIFSSEIDALINIGMSIITLRAFYEFVLFVSMYPRGFKDAIKLIWLDLSVFSISIMFLTWVQNN